MIMDKIHKNSPYDNLKKLDEFRFQDLLYFVFIQHDKFRIDQTAARMKIHPDTLYRYCRGELPFPVDRLDDLVEATDWKGWGQYFYRNTDYAIKKKLPQETRRLLSDIGHALSVASGMQSSDTSHI